MKFYQLVVTCCFLATSQLAVAEPDPDPIFYFPYVFPNPASAGQEVFLALTWNGCGGWTDPPSVQRLGSEITVSFLYNNWCAVPTTGGVLGFPLGHFAAGEYTVTYASQNTFGGWDPNPVQRITLLVNPIPRVPATSPGLLWALALGLVLCGVAGLTIRSSGPPGSVLR